MFAPHQIGLSRLQSLKLLDGKPVVIPFHKMGTGAGEHVVHLKAGNAGKMLMAYKKGKGMRLVLSPDELRETMKHGRGFWDSVKKGAKKVASLAKTALSHPEVQKLAKSAVSMGAEMAGKAVADATGNEELAHQVSSVLEKGAHHSIDAGGDLHVGLDSVKHDIKGHALGHLESAVQEHIPEAFQPMVKSAIKAGVEKIDAHPAMAKLEEHVEAIAQEQAEDEAGPASESDEEVGSGFRRRGGKLNFGKMVKSALKSPVAKQLEKMALSYGAPALGTALATAIGQPELGFVAGEALGQMGTKAIGSGIRPRRGRPQKTGGDLASESGPYKSVMRRYRGIMAGTERIMPAVPAGARANPLVKPSSKEMILSPYQSETSPAMHPFIPVSSIQAGGTSHRPMSKGGAILNPAMNPFIPKSSVQAGGQSSGYGGKGLYGTRRGSGLY